MKHILPVSILALLVAILAVVSGPSAILGQSVSQSRCTVSSASAVTVGNDVSGRVLATSTTRAWAIVQQMPNATNTVWLSFSNGASSTLENGLALYADTSNASSSEKQFSFGLNTAFPYVGEVEGITDAGTTTVLVTECNF